MMSKPWQGLGGKLAERWLGLLFSPALAFWALGACLALPAGRCAPLGAPYRATLVAAEDPADERVQGEALTQYLWRGSDGAQPVFVDKGATKSAKRST